MRNYLLAALCLLGASRTALAFNPQPDPPGRFYLVGIAQEQTAVVSLVNTGASTCNVTLRLLDSDGDVIAARTDAVAPGGHASLAVRSADFIPLQATRALVRANVTRSDDPNAVPPDYCIPSFAIRSAAGATTFAATRPARLQTTRAVTPVLTPGTNQRAQLAMINTGSQGTCQATLSFRAPDNRTIVIWMVNLAPGESVVRELAGGGVMWGQAVITENPATPGIPPDACAMSYATYDTSSGATAVGGALQSVAP